MTDWGAAPGTKKQAGGSAPGTSSWGGSPKASGGSGTTRQTPDHDLTNSLVRLARAYSTVGDDDKKKILATISANAPGLKHGQIRQIASNLPTGTEFSFQKGGGGGPGAIDYLTNPVGAAGQTGASVLGKTLDIVSRPAQAVQSTVAEAAREGGWQHADLGKLATAAKEGLQNKRHDTISSIIEENTGYKLKGAARFGADLGGSIALDPLTYLTFGQSDAAKVALRATSDALGAGRAAEIAQKGAGILSAEEKLRLGKSTVEALKGVRGGVKVHGLTFGEKSVPFTHGQVPRLSVAREGRTVIPGPFAARKAGKIIEGQGAHLDEAARARLAQISDEGTNIVTKANELDAQAAHIEAAGQDASALRSQISELDARAAGLAQEAEHVQRGVVTGAKDAARTLENSPLGRLGSRIADSKLAETARGIFIPRGNVAHKFGEAAAMKLDDARTLYRGEFQAGVEDHVSQLLHAAKDTGVTNDELVHVIGPALDIGGDASKVPEKLQPMYHALADVRDRFTQAQIQAGVTHEEALHLTDEYFPRYVTSEARKIMTGRERSSVIPSVPGEASLTRAPSGQLRKRTANVDEPISQINAGFAAEHGGVKKFEDNPLTAISRRAVEAESDVATKHYVDRVLKLRDDSGNRLFYTADEVQKNKLTLPKDWVEEKVPGVGVVHAPREIMGEVKKAQELLVNDQHLKTFIDGLDRWMALWKGYATVPLPFGLGFHERNAIGNVFLNWLADISPGSPAYARAAKIQHLIGKGRKEGDVLRFLSGEDRRLVEEARQHDVIGEGFYGFDLPKNQDVAVHVPFKQASKAEKRRRVLAKSNPLSTDNALIAGGRKFGSAIEENARLAHFIEMRQRYGSAAEAARSVRKYLFDYSDLTATERQVFKRGMAFYTFTRKNLPVQVGALLRTPGKFSHLEAARVAAADTAPRPKGLYPSYLPELGGTPLPLGVSKALSHVPGLGVKGDQQLVFAPDLPLINATSSITPAVQLLASLPGVNKIPGVPHNPEGAPGAFRDLATQSVSGGAPGAFMTGVQALGAEKDFFSGRPLQGRVAAPAYALVPGLNQDRVLNGKKQPTITAKGQYVAESLMPLLGKVSSFVPQGDYEQEKAPRRRLSTLAGLRVYPLGPGTSRGEALRRNALVAAVLADLKSKGVDVPTSRTSKKKKKGGW
jgi:hypothetical protein